MPGSACPQRAEPPGWSVTSATIPSGIPPSLWAPPHSCARPCTTVWLSGRVDPWRTHGGLVAWLIGRGACGTHGRIDRAAVLRMACVCGRLRGVRTATCPTGPPAFVAVGTFACVGALQWPRWRGPLPRLALRRRLPAASAGDRGSAVACGPGACARAPPRLVAAPGCRPGRQLTLLSCAYAGRTEQLGSRPLPGGGVKKWRKQAVKEKKSDVVINHRCRGHKSFSDFDSWGQRSQLPLRGQAGAGRLLEGSRRAAAATTMAATC